MVIRELERRALGPLFGDSESPIFRMAVGSFFSVKSMSDWKAGIEKQADEIMAKAERQRKRKAKR